MSKTIVVDTNGFIKYPIELTNLSQTNQLITTSGVISEIKDKTTRENVSLRFPNLQILKPTKESMEFIAEFAKKTGDNISLSLIDLEVIALAVDTIKDLKKFDSLRKTPQKAQLMKGGEVVTTTRMEDDTEHINTIEEGPEEEEEVEKQLDEKIQNVEEDEEWIEITSKQQRWKQTQQTQQPRKKKENHVCGWGNFNSDDEDGWIGAENISKIRFETIENLVLDDIDCSVVTEDFAMQNIILQMGIPLLSIDGKRISKLKSYVLECYSCWTVTRKNDLIFCKKCGKPTLLKVTCEFMDDGSYIMYKKKNRQPVVRGNRFPMAEPKAGKRVDGMILHEDDLMQPKVQRFLKIQESKMRKEADTFERGMEVGSELVNFKSERGKMKALTIGRVRGNPNANGKKKKK